MTAKIGGILGIREGTEALVKMASKFHFECLDLFLPVWQDVLSENNIRVIREMTGIPMTFHYKTSTILASPKTYDLIRNQLVYYIDVARSLRVSVITIHPPSTRRIREKEKKSFEDERWYHVALDNHVTEDFEESIAYLSRLICDLRPLLESSGVRIAIENTDKNTRDFGTRIETLKDIQMITSRSQSIFVGMCFDVYKAYTTEEHLDFEKYSDKIFHVQLSDYSESDQKGHIAIGRGNIPISEIIKQCQRLNYIGHYTIEVPEIVMRESVDFVKKLL